jgi:hypothetical protein
MPEKSMSSHYVKTFLFRARVDSEPNIDDLYNSLVTSLEEEPNQDAIIRTCLSELKEHPIKSREDVNKFADYFDSIKT